MRKSIESPFLLSVLILLNGILVSAQQKPDTTFRAKIHQPAYKHGEGPVVCIDEAHQNLHTRKGRFLAFSRLLEQDGYRVRSIDQPITDVDVLRNCSLLVVANALHPSNKGHWVLPTPSAFTDDEINHLRQWVQDGGRLLLIADHMPFAGAAAELAATFGFEFLNGFAMTSNDFWPPSKFAVKDGGLRDSPVVDGMMKGEAIADVATFTGSAFTIPKTAVPVISFSEEHRSLQPDTAWKFSSETPSVFLSGYHQGALLSFGKGKVAVFGEAAMFTAQISNRGVKTGFNSEYAKENVQLVINVVHWLDGVTEYSGTKKLTDSSESSNEIALTPEETAILKVNREMEDAFHANDFLKVASFYADEAVMVGNGHEVIGRHSIDTYWGGLKDRGISWVLENVDLEVHGDVAFQRGISRMKFFHNDNEHLSEVRFTLVWKKINGDWRIAIDQYSKL
ncbi:MAG: DUF4440 domain-containing protein [Cryomorphaceae bacterium]